MGGVTNVRVKKLARRLGRPLTEVLDTLRSLGLDRYAHPEAVLPGERVGAVEAALAEGVDGASDFDSLMASLGVRRLDEDRRPPSGRHSSPSSRQRPVSGPQPTRQPAPSQPPPAIAPSERHTVPLPALSDRGREGDLEQALAALRESLAKVRRDLAAQTASRRAAERTTDGLRRSLASLRGDLAVSEARVGELQQQLESPAGGAASLHALFEARGVRGQDETVAAITALAGSRRLDAVLRELAAPRPKRLAAALQDHLLLHCGQADCHALAGRAVVVVPRDRCEVCGGHGLTGPLERFSDALLLHGWTRVGLQGGKAVLLRLLEEHVDRRIQVTFFGDGSRRPEAPPQVLIRWLPGDAAPTFIDGVVLCTERSLGAMLLRAAAEVERS